jgi:hypothetical protein
VLVFLGIRLQASFQYPLTARQRIQASYFCVLSEENDDWEIKPLNALISHAFVRHQKGRKYCSQFCKDAGSKEIEIACDCHHPACSK